MTDVVKPEVLDAITEVVMNAPGPRERAIAIYQLVQEIYETVQWLHAPSSADEELLSLSPLLIEALRHQRRMASGDAELDPRMVNCSSAERLAAG